MPYSIDDLDNLPDDKLLEISNGIVNDGKSYTAEYDFSRHPFVIKAKIILHNRKKKTDRRMLIMTLIILILTAYLVYREYSKEPIRPIPANAIQMEQIQPQTSSGQPQKNDNNKRDIHSTTPVDNKRAYDLQESCSKHAQIFFDYFVTDPQAKQSDEFSSHFNMKLNNCFVLVKHGIIDVKDIYTEHLYDAVEKKQYGSLAWKSQDGKKYWEVRPLICEMRDSHCNSREEFDAFVKSYMVE